MGRLFKPTDLHKDLSDARGSYWLFATVSLFIGFVVSAFFPPLFIVWGGGLIYALVHWQTAKRRIRDWHAQQGQQVEAQRAARAHQKSMRYWRG